MKILRSLILLSLALLTVLDSNNGLLAAEPDSDNNTATITGCIIDFENLKPLYYANVFLGRTTLGAATNERGLYRIDNVPLGDYTIVVTMMGYERKAGKIQIDKPGEYEFGCILEKEIIRGQSVTVTGSRDRKWERRKKRFRKQFFGETPNAKHCTILNPEQIDFHVHEKTRDIIASSREPLNIENRALGYRVTLYLDEYASSKDGVWKFRGEMKFDPLESESDEEDNRWEQNRKIAYAGSFRHFIAALARDRLIEEGFHIYRDPGYRGDGRVNRTYECKVDQILNPGPNAFIKHLKFDKFICVFYDIDRESDAYDIELNLIDKIYLQNRDGKWYQVSWLDMNKEAAINPLGQIDDPYALSRHGRWSKECFAEELPWNYIPADSAAEDVNP